MFVIEILFNTEWIVQVGLYVNNALTSYIIKSTRNVLLMLLSHLLYSLMVSCFLCVYKYFNIHVKFNSLFVDVLT